MVWRFSLLETLSSLGLQDSPHSLFSCLTGSAFSRSFAHSSSPLRPLNFAVLQAGSWDLFSICTHALAGVSNLLTSLGHTGRRVVLSHTLNTQTLMKTDEPKKSFKEIYNLVLGCTHGHPGAYAVRGPRVGHPCQAWGFKWYLTLTTSEFRSLLPTSSEFQTCMAYIPPPRKCPMGF